MPTKTQLIGGAFQDTEGNLLVSGYLDFVLSSDEVVTGVGQVCSGITTRVLLDAVGSVIVSPAQSIWANSDMLPVNSYYKVTGYNAKGQRAWGPNNQQVVSGATFDVGTWIPNQVVSWTPPLTTTELEVNATPNVVQGVLNLKNSATVTFTDEGDGSVHATAASTSSTLQANGVALTTQSPANFQSGSGVVVTNPSAGNVAFTADPLALLGGIRSFVAGTRGTTESALATGFSFLNTASVSPVTPATATVPQSLEVIVGSNPGTGFMCSGESGVAAFNDTLGTFISFQCRFIPTNLTAGSKMWVGFTSVDPAAGTPAGLFTATPLSTFGFRYFPGDVNWQSYSSSSSAQTVVGSSVPPVANTPVLLRVDKVGSSLVFKINGTVVATISTNLPTTSAGLTPVWGVCNDDGVGLAGAASCSFVWQTIV